MNLKALTHLWHISRPRFYSYLFGPYLVGVAAAATSTQDFFNPWFWILLLFFIAPANLFLYGINDLFDAETDAVNPKKHSKEHLLLKHERQLLQVTLLLIGIFTALLAIQMTFLPLALLCIFMILAIGYSAPPLRFKGRPFLDSYSNVLYILPGLLGYSLFAHQLPPVSVIVAGWAWAAAMHAYSAVPDIAADRQAGIPTVATTLGANKTIWFVIFHWLFFAIIVSWLLPLPWGFIAWAYPVLGLYTWKNLEKIEGIYWLFPAITTTIGFVGFWYFIFSRLYV